MMNTNEKHRARPLFTHRSLAGIVACGCTAIVIGLLANGCAGTPHIQGCTSDEQCDEQCDNGGVCDLSVHACDCK